MCIPVYSDYEQSLLLFQERHQSTLFASLFNGVLGRSSSNASATPTTTTGLFGMRILAETTLQPPSLVHHIAQRRFTRDVCGRHNEYNRFWCFCSNVYFEFASHYTCNRFIEFQPHSTHYLVDRKFRWSISLCRCRVGFRN